MSSDNRLKNMDRHEPNMATIMLDPKMKRHFDIVELSDEDNSENDGYSSGEMSGCWSIDDMLQDGIHESDSSRKGDRPPTMAKRSSDEDITEITCSSTKRSSSQELAQSIISMLEKETTRSKDMNPPFPGSAALTRSSGKRKSSTDFSGMVIAIAGDAQMNGSTWEDTEVSELAIELQNGVHVGEQ